MKQYRFVQNTPFHLNKKASNSVNPISVINFLKINSITSLSNQTLALNLAALSTLVLGFEFMHFDL
jgi:hypothetical protein